MNLVIFYIICRVYKKEEEGKLNVNIKWEVVEAEGRNLTIQNMKSKETKTFHEDSIDKHFRYVYCAIFHSRQGTTIRDNIRLLFWKFNLPK